MENLAFQTILQKCAILMEVGQFHRTPKPRNPELGWSISILPKVFVITIITDGNVMAKINIASFTITLKVLVVAYNY